MSRSTDRLLKKAGKVIAPAIAGAFSAGVKYGERVCKTEYVYGKSGLHRRSGNLGRSIKSMVRIRNNRIEGKISSDSVYAPSHEYGATIRPVNVQWLTIPLDAAKTAAGVTRGGARSFKNTFFITSKTGTLLLMQRQGKNIVPLFVLKKQVTIPKRQFLEPSAMEAKRYIEKDIPHRIKKALRT